MLALEDRVTLVAEGWRSELAGRDGRQVGAGDGRGRRPKQAAHAALGAEPAGFVPIDPGRAGEPWLGNVVALGDAAAHFEPLGWLNLDLAHRQLALLLELLPGREPDPRERAEFNRRAGLMADRVRDCSARTTPRPARRISARSTARPSSSWRSTSTTGAAACRSSRKRRCWCRNARRCSTRSAIRPGEGALALAADPREGEAARAAFEAKAGAALQATPPYPEWLQRVLRA